MAYNEGEITVQSRAGVTGAAAKVGRIIGNTIPPAAAQFLAAQPIVVLATTNSPER